VANYGGAETLLQNQSFLVVLAVVRSPRGIPPWVIPGWLFVHGMNVRKQVAIFLARAALIRIP